MTTPELEAACSEWHGDKVNGIEVRYYGNYIDEVVMYHDGDVVFHLEAMSDTCYWFGLYGKTHECHVHINSKNNRSHIQAMAEGWTRVMTDTPDLEAAERELAEALRQYDDNALKAIRDMQQQGGVGHMASLRFALTYELARRQRERQQNEATL